MRHVRGDGNITTQDRHENHFSGVKSYGSFDVFVSSGANYSIKVEADENLQQYIETRVEGDNLKIGTTRGVSLSPTKGLKVYITAPSFQELSTSGSGTIKGSGRLTADDRMELGIAGSGDIDADVKAKTVSLHISGSGSIALSGEANSLETSIAGDGDIHASRLQAEDATVHISGSGDVEVNVTKQLDIHIAGSGDVQYVGNPQISQHIAGSGDVRKLQ